MSGVPASPTRRVVVSVVASEGRDVARGLELVLQELGYAVHPRVAPAALSKTTLSECDVVLLDAAVDDIPGVVRRHLARSGVPLVVFASTDDSDAAIAALDAGADDLVTTSSSVEEVGARVRAVLRRRGRRTGSAVILTGGPVVMDVGHRRVTVAGQPVVLTALEFKLLAYFLMHPDEPITRERLLQDVWGYGVGSTTTVTVNVRRLREKIEADPADPMLIRTAWGVGYRFSPTP